MSLSLSSRSATKSLKSQDAVLCSSSRSQSMKTISLPLSSDTFPNMRRSSSAPPVLPHLTSYVSGSLGRRRRAARTHLAVRGYKTFLDTFESARKVFTCHVWCHLCFHVPRKMMCRLRYLHHGTQAPRLNTHRTAPTAICSTKQTHHHLERNERNTGHERMLTCNGVRGSQQRQVCTSWSVNKPRSNYEQRQFRPLQGEEAVKSLRAVSVAVRRTPDSVEGEWGLNNRRLSSSNLFANKQ